MTFHEIDGETFIIIHGIEEWRDFYAENREAIDEECGDEFTALDMAEDHDLVLGGGAAPLFRVGFIAG